MVEQSKKAYLYPQEDVNYTPISTTAGQMCGGCRWFNDGYPSGDMSPSYSHCHLVQSYPIPIRETGWCDQYAAIPEPEPSYIEVLEELTEALATKEHKPNLLERIKALFLFQAKARDEPFIGFKSISENRWLACWGNNFEDREGEIFAEKATDEFIERVDNGIVPYPKLHYWHVPRPIGEADFLARIDHMNVASGTYYDDPLSQAMKKSLKEDGVLPVSHGYYYYPAALKNGVYHYYDAFEISPLPRNKEANRFTSFKEDKGMNDEKRRDLATRLGKEFAEKYISEVESFSKEIEKTGQSYKEFTATDTEARKEISEVKSAVTDMGAAMNTLTSSIKELVDGLKAKTPTDDKKKDDDEDKMDKLFGKKKELDDAIAAAKAMAATLEAKSKAFDELTPRIASKDKSTEIDPATNPDLAALIAANQTATEAKKEFSQLFGGIFPTNGNGAG